MRTTEGNDPSGRINSSASAMILKELIIHDALRVIWLLLLGVLMIGFALTTGFDRGGRRVAAFRGEDRH